MKWLVMFFFALLAAGLQWAIPPASFLGGAKTPFLTILVAYYALAHDSGAMLVAGLVAGVLQGALSPVPLGQSVVCFCVAGLLAGRFRRLVVPEVWLTASAFGAASSFLVSGFLWGLMMAKGVVAVPPLAATARAFGAALLGGVAAPVFFLAADAVDRLLGNVRVRREIDVYD